MIIPLQITFHNIPPSEAVEAKIRSLADKLEHFYNRITSCRVIVDAPHRHQRNGKLYQVRIDITVPTGEIVVNRDPPEHQSHEDIYVAIRDAFDAAKRKLQDHTSMLRQETKTHEEQPHGRITSLFSDEGYGFIETPDGSEVYFHRNSLFNGDFEQLQVGDEIRFAQEEGDKGPQASTVRLIGKHRLQG
ncbi:cold-shock DNA-binding protein family [Trichormus variabilis ATCC 29413]|uniref:Cold-shock DNA-binding protein family n=2 Tax=Anabaena variabilis TaxID=264691 RepID=Q3M5P3_TRIV2|nr:MULTISPECIES: HPF/RaiA family ribosome-associated protein [Nostocaceae]ABA23693.1 cold-shock DNA-binding protein family [Trichormus variabilis ATCC 29413]MBC1213147.1 HPF/RaiA family ribosome-associated protein [Trichormus variabilis ARAD]MBC1253980.1 HPF/RaiA family ribosome-associated protein [Trichormus variabilis V5]MBC1265577.1 HPF/RaiA family ribosome-associated protein [Trichormus variabilis FSR]MBC1301752.1 HPF/RaiA family ribosome-associated protein [Trichormus variabilis N2B]